MRAVSGPSLVLAVRQRLDRGYVTLSVSLPLGCQSILVRQRLQWSGQTGYGTAHRCGVAWGYYCLFPYPNTPLSGENPGRYRFMLTPARCDHRDGLREPGRTRGLVDRERRRVRLFPRLENGPRPRSLHRSMRSRRGARTESFSLTGRVMASTVTSRLALSWFTSMARSTSSAASKLPSRNRASTLGNRTSIAASDSSGARANRPHPGNPGRVGDVFASAWSVDTRPDAGEPQEKRTAEDSLLR